MVKITRLPSGNYRTRVHLGGGKYKSITGPDKKSVQLEAAKFEVNTSAVSAALNIGNMTVKDALDKYIDSKANILSPSTYREYLQTAENNFSGIKALPITSITETMIQVEINILAAKNSSKTVRNKFGVLRSAIKMFRPDFSFKVTLPPKSKPNVVIPEEQEMLALFDLTHNTEIEIPILLGAISGLRASEILGLKWSEIDFKKRTMRIKEAKVKGVSKGRVSKGTKTTAGTRTIKILPHIYDALKRHYNPESEYVTSLTYPQIYSRYKKALKKCCPGKNYSFHELRHYAASVMILVGIPIKYIADMLGHETEDMVNKVYGHIMSDKRDMMFERLETYYSETLSKCNFNKSDTVCHENP